MSDKYTHIQLHFIFFFACHGRLSPQISFCDPHPTVFSAFFFLPLDTNWLRGESSFRPEPLRTPPHGPCRVGIQFEYDFKKSIDRTDTPLEMTHMRFCKRVTVPLSANTVKSTCHQYLRHTRCHHFNQA